MERAERLHAAGYRVESEPLTPAVLRALRADPPDAVVIDLGRLGPAHAGILAWRCGGARPDADTCRWCSRAARRAKVVEYVKQHLTDAAYGDWRGIRLDAPARHRASADRPRDAGVGAGGLLGDAAAEEARHQTGLRGERWYPARRTGVRGVVGRAAGDRVTLRPRAQGGELYDGKGSSGSIRFVAARARASWSWLPAEHRGCGRRRASGSPGPRRRPASL